VKKNGAFILILIMLTGMIMQLALLFLVMEPDEVEWFDPQDYVRIGRELAQGEPFSTIENERNLYFSPGYPCVLAVMVKIAGPRVKSLRIFHILLFPVFLYFLYRIGKDWKNEQTGLILAALALLYPFYIYVPLTLYPEAILLYIIPLITWLMLKNGKTPRWHSLLLSGIIIALAVMIRPTAIFIIPVFVLYVSIKSGWKWHKFLLYGVLICIIPVLSVFGWMLRNNTVHGKPVFSSAGGYNLLMSYNANATIGVKLDYLLPEEVQKRLDTAKNKEEVQVIAQEEAFKFIKENPGKALELAFFKQLDLWNPFPRTTTTSGFARPKFKLISAVPYLFFLILGIIGFIKNRKDGFIIALICLIFLNCLLNGLIAVSVRYRLITDFVFIFLAATVIADFWSARIKSNIIKESGAS